MALVPGNCFAACIVSVMMHSWYGTVSNFVLQSGVSFHARRLVQCYAKESRNAIIAHSSECSNRTDHNSVLTKPRTSVGHNRKRQSKAPCVDRAVIV